VAALNDADGTLDMLRRLLPEFQPAHPEPATANVGAPYADGF